MTQDLQVHDRATKKAKTNEGSELKYCSDEVGLSFIEFYSGVGGWTMALEEAISQISEVRIHLHRLAALDHSDLCTKVFEHNFGSDSRSFAIDRLTLKQIAKWDAAIWVMSPPCQPHTRQHSNQSADLDDPRSRSFLHLLDLIGKVEGKHLPALLFLENVVGFESSKSFRQWVAVLEKRNYNICNFHLTPTQVGLPNDRPRYFSVAVRKSLMKDEPSRDSSLFKYWDTRATDILKEIPELGVSAVTGKRKLPSISMFLDERVDLAALRVPSKILEGNSAWCFDIVTPKSQRSSCFTQSYGRFIRGTGSILYQDGDRHIELLAPAEREFNQYWAQDLDLIKFRYFSGVEMTRLMGFPSSFSFPPGYTYKQQWKLIGNSLNVKVASKVVELGLRIITAKPVQ